MRIIFNETEIHLNLSEEIKRHAERIFEKNEFEYFESPKKYVCWNCNHSCPVYYNPLLRKVELRIDFRALKCQKIRDLLSDLTTDKVLLRLKKVPFVFDYGISDEKVLNSIDEQYVKDFFYERIIKAMKKIAEIRDSLAVVEKYILFNLRINIVLRLSCIIKIENLSKIVDCAENAYKETNDLILNLIVPEVI